MNSLLSGLGLGLCCVVSLYHLLVFVAELRKHGRWDPVFVIFFFVGLGWLVVFGVRYSWWPRWLTHVALWVGVVTQMLLVAAIHGLESQKHRRWLDWRQ